MCHRKSTFRTGSHEVLDDSAAAKHLEIPFATRYCTVLQRFCQLPDNATCRSLDHSPVEPVSRCIAQVCATGQALPTNKTLFK